MLLKINDKLAIEYIWNILFERKKWGNELEKKLKLILVLLGFEEKIKETIGDGLKYYICSLLFDNIYFLIIRSFPIRVN